MERCTGQVQRRTDRSLPQPFPSGWAGFHQHHTAKCCLPEKPLRTQCPCVLPGTDHRGILYLARTKSPDFQEANRSSAINRRLGTVSPSQSEWRDLSWNPDSQMPVKRAPCKQLFKESCLGPAMSTPFWTHLSMEGRPLLSLFLSKELVGIAIELTML